MEDVIKKIEQYGKEIGKLSSTCEVSQKIITYYNMWYKCPGDPGSATLVKIHLEEWLKKYHK